MTTIIDRAMIDAEAAKPEYDWARGLMHRDGTPLDKHYARLNLLRASPAGQRVQASRDQMIYELEKAHSPAKPAALKMDSVSAYAAMCEQMSNAWKNLRPD